MTIFGAFSCNKPKDRIENDDKKREIEKPIANPDNHNSLNSLDWKGTYKEILPCANCEGVETILTLNSDGTYILITNYLGRNDALEEEERGIFSWEKNGSVIKLATSQSQYKVGENLLWQLDVDGKLITGKLSDHYILKKSQ